MATKRTGEMSERSPAKEVRVTADALLDDTQVQPGASSSAAEVDVANSQSRGNVSSGSVPLDFLQRILDQQQKNYEKSLEQQQRNHEHTLSMLMEKMETSTRADVVSLSGHAASTPNAARSPSQVHELPEREDAGDGGNMDLENEADPFDRVIAQTVKDEKKKLPGFVMAKIKHALKEVKQGSGRIAGVMKRIQKIKEDVEALSEGRTPPGCKPSKLAYECEESHAIPSDEQLNNSFATFTPTYGQTFFEVKQALHLWHLEMQKKLDIAITEERHKNLTEQHNFVAFIKQCKVTDDDFDSEKQKLEDKGIDIPPGLFPDSELVEQTATKIYKSFVTKMVEENLQESEKNKKKEKSHQKLLEEIGKADPQKHFTCAVQQALVELGKGKGKGKGKSKAPDLPSTVIKLDNDEEQYVDHMAVVMQNAGKFENVEAFVKTRRFTKKELNKRKQDRSLVPRGAPRDAWGKKEKKKGKGKGKGKENEQKPVSKGKGKEQSPNGSPPWRKGNGKGKAGSGQKRKGKSKGKKGKGDSKKKKGKGKGL